MATQFRLGVICALYFSLHASALAADFQWIAPGDGAWTNAANWNQPFPPGGADVLLFTGVSTAGPVAIDLGVGQTQFINRISVNGLDTSGGAYTFENGTLQIVLGAGNAVLSGNGGGALTFQSDLQFSSAGTQRLNVQASGDKITINGDIASAAPSGTTILMPTVVNTNLPVGVEVTGIISDGTAQMALSAGFDGNNAHQGTVRITGDNTYTGATRVYQGTLEFDSIENIGGPANALGQPAAGDSTIRLGTLAPGSSSPTFRYIGSGHTTDRDILMAGKANDGVSIDAAGTGPLILNGNINNPLNGQTLVFKGTNTADNEVSGSIQDPAGSGVTSVVKAGPGKWILSGDSPGLSNVFRVNEGELVVRGQIAGGAASVAAAATLAGGILTIDGGEIRARGIQNGGTLNFRSGVLNLAGTNTTNGGSFTVGTNGVGTLNLMSGNHAFDNVTLAGPDDVVAITSGTGLFDRLDNSNGGTLNLTGGTLNLTDAAPGQGLITGTGTINSTLVGVGDVTKIGSGTLAVNLNTHTNSGKTNINAGVLAVAPTARLSDASTVNVAAGATLRFLTTSSDSIFGLEGAGNVELGDAGLVLGNNGNSGGVGTFTGTIGDGPLPAAGSFEKRGNGTFNFDGNADYTGVTTITSGTMNVTGDIVGTSNVTVSTATLWVNGGTIDTPGNIRPLSNSAVFSIAGGLVKANAIDRTVNSQYLHQFNWTGGTVHLQTATAINGSTGTAINRPFAGSLTLDGDMALVVDDTFSVTNTGVLNINGGSVTADTIEAGPFSGAGGISFNAGTMRMRNDQTFDAGRLAALDIAAPLGNNRSLVVDGVATISAPLVLAGGSFSASAIANPENLILSSGTLEVTASDLDVAAGTSVDVTTGMTVSVTSGALNVADGGHFNAINATLNFSDGINNLGDVNLINSTVNGDLVNGPSGSANLLGSNSFGDDLVLSRNSQLFIDIAGDQPGEFDVVTVGGDATLDGLLNVSLSNGFVPMPGQQFTVLTASDTTDNGLTLGGPAASQFDMLVNLTSVVLQAIGALPGDFNGDGIFDCADVDPLVSDIANGLNTLGFDLTGDGLVNAADLTEWLTLAGTAQLPSGNAYLVGDANLDGVVDGSDFGAWNGNKFTNTAAWCSGDFNADGVVDGSDFGLWNGNKFTAADAAATVPEPASVTTVLLLLCLGSRRRATSEKKRCQVPLWLIG